MEKTLAEKIVTAVLDDLSGRSGIGDALDGCDDGIKLEIAESLRDEVQKVLDEESPP